MPVTLRGNSDFVFLALFKPEGARALDAFEIVIQAVDAYPVCFPVSPLGIYPILGTAISIDDNLGNVGFGF